MATGTTLRAEQWESDDAFLSSAQSHQSEADRDHCRAMGLYFKELSTAFLDTFCERTEKSLYLAQWLLIKTDTYGGGENSDTSPASPGSAQPRLWDLLAHIKQSQAEGTKNQHCRPPC
ncbi:unnamed protein product [Rangifer tarandus platyrhynchus]|uniref:Uncharacterized protein n=2 Tax=Rangifer tarandus platyrhynchus TaxID=3082113 RepID=A0ABN8ZSZ7_RANTA|nr:unnamed protein product [Rangifer tarandus platyrhynchus]